MSFLEQACSFFKTLVFARGDERTVYIGFYAGRVAWVFTTVLLLIWSWQGVLSTGGLPVQFVVLAAS